MDPALFRRAVQAIALGSQFSAGTLGGVVLGYLLDRWLGTGPLLLLLMALAGMMLGTWHLLRSLRNRFDEAPNHPNPSSEDPGTDRDPS